MAYSRYEYSKTVTFSRNTTTKAYDAQKAFLDTWSGVISKASFQSKLASFSVTVLEGIFNKTVYTAIPAAVISALSGANSWEKSEVQRIATKGKDEISDLMAIFLKNSNYASITFRVNYLAFKNLATGNTDFTIIQGNIVPTKITTTGGGTIPM